MSRSSQPGDSPNPNALIEISPSTSRLSGSWCSNDRPDMPHADAWRRGSASFNVNHVETCPCTERLAAAVRAMKTAARTTRTTRRPAAVIRPDFTIAAASAR